MRFSVCITVSLLLFAAWTRPAFPADEKVDPVDELISQRKWKQAVDVGFFEIQRSGTDFRMRVRLAYALFQLGFANGALQVLRPLTTENWKTLAAEKSKVAELVSLYQKKVPFNILPARTDAIQGDGFANGLSDEIEFSRGRTAFEQKQTDRARAHLVNVSKASRFYGPAMYLLGVLELQAGELKSAQANFSTVLDPKVFHQTSEFWQDVQGTFNKDVDASSMEVVLNSDWVRASEQLTDLAMMAMARVAYANRDFEGALNYYDRLPAGSRYQARAKLERVWTLLSLGRHQQAQAAALALQSEKNTFESIEALPVRALVLADQSRTEESRAEIERFTEVFKKAMDGLQQAGGGQGPEFLSADFKQDVRLMALEAFEAGIHREIAALRSPDHGDHRVFLGIASQIEPQLGGSRELARKIRVEQTDKRKRDLQRLYVQSRLILAETYLEDRERLRRDYQNASGDVERQKEHDRKLVTLLASAVDIVDDVMRSSPQAHRALEFRQAELLWELSTALIILDQSGQADKTRDPEALRKRALQIVRDIVDRHPEFPKHAQASFFLGFALMDTGQTEEAVRVLKRYAQTYPMHVHSADAWRMLADEEFEKNRFREADEYYRQILKFPDSPILGYALYKMGWSAYNRKQFSAALLALEQAILWARNREHSTQLLNLEREARRDIVSIYSEVGDAKKAREYFDRFLGGNSSEWLADLAKTYDDGGLFEKSGFLYRQLLTTTEDPVLRLTFQSAIVRGAYQMRQWDNLLKDSTELVESYRTMLETPAAADTVSGKAEKIFHDNILTQHFEFDKSASEQDIDRILKLDGLYLRAFEKWPSSEAPHYQHAHFLLKHGRYALSAKAFEKHWLQFRTTLQEPIREESLRNLIHALEEVELLDKNESSVVSENGQKLLSYTSEYAGAYSKTKHARAIAYLRTTVLFKYQQIDSGIEETQRLFDTDVTDALAKKAFKNLKVAYYSRKDWASAAKWARAQGGKSELSGTEFQGDLALVEGETAFLWAESETDDAKSASLFLDLGKNPKAGPLRPKAYFNAFFRLQKAGQVPEALAVAETLEKSFPDFSELPRLAGVRAAIYQEAGDYVRAATLFDQFLRKPPADVTKEILQQARFNLLLIRENLDGMDKVLADYRTLEKSLAPESPLLTAVKNALQRADVVQVRKLASVKDSQVLDRWEPIRAAQAKFLKLPFPEKKGDLAGTIRNGLGTLEKLVKRTSDFSADKKNASPTAFESFCTLASIYDAARAGIGKMGETQPDEVKVELEKIASPLGSKAQEFAATCITRSAEALHDGSEFRKVVATWGWMADPIKKETSQRLYEALQPPESGWIDPIADGVPKDESAIVAGHLQKQATLDSWYALARARFEKRQYGLCRLSLLEGLGKDPKSPRFLNLLAQTEQAQGGDPVAVNVLRERAFRAGSGYAARTLATDHLQGLRFETAIQVLQEALDQKWLEDDKLKSILQGGKS